MNKQELQLYNFLNEMPEDEFDLWIAKATDEQLDLADKLFDEAKLSGQGVQDTYEDLTLAQNVLKQFTLGA